MTKPATKKSPEPRIPVPLVTIEASIGREILALPFVAEVLEVLRVAENRESIASAAGYAVLRGLKADGLLDFRDHWTTWPRLAELRARAGV